MYEADKQSEWDIESKRKREREGKLSIRSNNAI